jgi:predicted DNA-binding WGR domain protein
MIVTLYKTGSQGLPLYYTIHDRQVGLSQPNTLTITWSRGAGRGREKFYLFDSIAAKDKMIRSLLSRRTRDGYRLLYSFSRDSDWTQKTEPETRPIQTGQAQKASS